MVDQTATLNANICVLIAAINNLTTAFHDHTRVCDTASTKAAAQDNDPVAALSDLSLTPSPPSTPSPYNDSSTGDSPDVVRERLTGMTGPTQGAWYIVTVGHEPGVYQHIAEVAHLTSGVSGNAYKKYSSQAGAIDAYERAWNLGAVRRVR